MNTIAYIHFQFDALRRQYSMALSEITDEKLNWVPPGTANAIGVTLLHTIAGEDMFVHRLILGCPTLWETGPWAEKIGVSVPPGGPAGWDEAKQAKLNLASIMEFQEAVCQETSAYLGTLTSEDLDRPISFFGQERPLAALLNIIVSHSMEHLGEILVLKGIQAG